MKDVWKVIDTTPYRVWLLLYVGDHDGMVRTIKRLKNITFPPRFAEKAKGLVGSFDFTEEKRYGIVWLSKFDWTAAYLTVLVHEVRHAVVHILDAVEVKYGSECDEARAYFQDHLLLQCLQFLQKTYRAEEEDHAVFC